MYLFTYKEYFKYAEMLQIYGVNEESAEYIFDVEEEKTHQYKDKIFKEILSNKKEVVKFIKKYLGDELFEKLTEEDLEKYNKEFITQTFRKREADIVYKIAQKDLYIIIEHQSEIDYDMPERMTRYCMELIRDIRKSTNKIFEPVICPIVLYTGNRKWTMNAENEDNKRFNIQIFKYPKYNLIDINNYTKRELVQEDTGMSKALLFEKTNSKEELKVVMNEIFRKELTKEEKEYITMVLKYSNKVRNFIPKEREKYIEKLEERGDEEMKFGKYFSEWLEEKEMEGIAKGEKRGEKRGEKLGIAKAIKQIVKEMLQKQMSDEDIMDITKISEQELQKLKMA